MLKLVAALVLAPTLAAPAGADDPMRYVVPKPESAGGWTMWTSWEALNACAAAVLAASRRTHRPVGMDCNALVDTKVAVGEVRPGNGRRAPRLASLPGDGTSPGARRPLEGAVGCITGRALTSIKPE
jgi:hypothetical protein